MQLFSVSGQLDSRGSAGHREVERMIISRERGMITKGYASRSECQTKGVRAAGPMTAIFKRLTPFQVHSFLSLIFHFQITVGIPMLCQRSDYVRIKLLPNLCAKELMCIIKVIKYCLLSQIKMGSDCIRMWTLGQGSLQLDSS